MGNGSAFFTIIKSSCDQGIGENGVDITSLRDYNYSISHIL